jgi:hypothetical protein
MRSISPVIASILSLTPPSPNSPKGIGGQIIEQNSRKDAKEPAMQQYHMIQSLIPSDLVPLLLDLNPDLPKAVGIAVSKFFGVEQEEPETSEKFPPGVTDQDLISLEELCQLCDLPYRIIGDGTRTGFGQKFRTRPPNVFLKELNEALAKDGYASAAFDPTSGKFHFVKPREQDGERQAA